MSPVPRHVAIVGASLAGTRTMRGLRRLGYDGRISLIGDEPHLAYDRPPLSKQFLVGSVGADELALERPELYEDVDVQLGRRAISLDTRARSLILDDGQRIVADAVVVATGARPRRLPGLRELGGVHVLRTVEDGVAIRDAFSGSPRVVVVGGGFIGSEVASSARRRGLEVTVLEALEAPLVRGVGSRLGRVLGELHRDEGVDLRTGAVVQAIDGDAHVRSVRLVDGTTIAADVVIIGVGVVPATEWLEGSGLRVADGLVCDRFCRAVGVPEVWAAGDVARWWNPRYGEEVRVEHWTNAADQGHAVATNLLATDPVAFAPVPYVWSDQYDTRIQVLGRVSGDDDITIVRGSLRERRFIATFSRSGRLRGAVGIGMPGSLMRLRGDLERAETVEDLRTEVEA